MEESSDNLTSDMEIDELSINMCQVEEHESGHFLRVSIQIFIS
jgi:hypothetical protein